MDDTTKAPAPRPDMMEQAAGFLRDFIDAGAAKREPGIVPIAGALLAIAGELRDIHNVLHEINERDETRWALEVA